jgi:hypothetical protein
MLHPPMAESYRPSDRALLLQQQLIDKRWLARFPCLSPPFGSSLTVASFGLSAAETSTQTGLCHRLAVLNWPVLVKCF